MSVSLLSQKLSIWGFLISSSGVKANLAKFRAVRDFPVPKNEKDVRVFLGLNWLLIENASIAGP